jgi:hypothetical protein
MQHLMLIVMMALFALSETKPALVAVVLDHS